MRHYEIQIEAVQPMPNRSQSKCDEPLTKWVSFGLVLILISLVCVYLTSPYAAEGQHARRRLTKDGPWNQWQNDDNQRTLNLSIFTKEEEAPIRKLINALKTEKFEKVTNKTLNYYGDELKNIFNFYWAKGEKYHVTVNKIGEWFQLYCRLVSFRRCLHSTWSSCKATKTFEKYFNDVNSFEDFKVQFAKLKFLVNYDGRKKMHRALELTRKVYKSNNAYLNRWLEYILQKLVLNTTKKHQKFVAKFDDRVKAVFIDPQQIIQEYNSHATMPSQQNINLLLGSGDKKAINQIKTNHFSAEKSSSGAAPTSPFSSAKKVKPTYPDLPASDSNALDNGPDAVVAGLEVATGTFSIFKGISAVLSVIEGL